MSNSEKNLQFKFDEIDYWSEVKLDIIKKYANPYSLILSKNNFEHYYIDAFSGAVFHKSKKTEDYILGSPINALLVKPRFKHFFFIDLNRNKTDFLRDLIGENKDVTIKTGDCNVILLKEVFPKINWNERKRALCLLDPYGLHLNWDVIKQAGKMKSIEIFLNFPVMDMNRNALWQCKSKVSQKQIQRMNNFWGDETWQDIIYDTSGDLFGHPEKVKNSNSIISQAFKKRLKNIAGFNFVPEPIPMRNSIGKIIYYLFFASRNSTGAKIVKHIFNKYKDVGKT